MSLASNLQTAFTRVATEFKTIRTLIGGSGTASISALTTTDKSSLVAAINETKAGNAGTPPDASETVKGIAENATQVEVNAGTLDANYFVSPLKFATRLAAFAQPLSANLTTLAGVASGVMGRSLLGAIDAAAAKTLLALTKTDVGLPLVPNVDATARASHTGTQPVATITGLATVATSGLKADVGLALVPNVDATARANHTGTQAVGTITGLAAVATSGAKADVGLSLVPNVDATARASHTGTQAASTITGLSTVATSGSAADLTGVLGTAQLPPLAINDTFAVVSQAAMLALTAQRGDVAIRSDIARSFILTADAPATLANWVQITAAGDVISVAGRSGAVVLTSTDVGLGNVSNTSDAAKPVSTAQAAADALAMVKTANLSDVANLVTARTNLSVYSQAEVGDPTTDFAATFVAGLV